MSLTEFKAKALALAPQIKAVLNFTVSDSVSPVQILNQLLEQIGVECIYKWKTIDGKKVRIYSIDTSTWQITKEVIERRRARRERISDLGSPPASISRNTEGCAEDKSAGNSLTAAQEQELASSSSSTLSDGVMDTPQQILLRLQDDSKAWLTEINGIQALYFSTAFLTLLQLTSCTGIIST